MIKRKSVGNWFHLRPRESCIRILRRHVGRREWEREAQSHARAVETNNIRRLQNWRLRTAVVQAIWRVADFEELRQVLDRGVIQTGADADTGFPWSASQLAE